MRFGPGHVSFEPKQYGSQSCCFERLKDRKVGGNVCEEKYFAKA